jgi:hypothetical protein
MKHSLPENLLALALIGCALYVAYIIGVAIIRQPWLNIERTIAEAAK